MPKSSRIRLMDCYINDSPITYAENLKGNLMIIHGNSDDNVHYHSFEILYSELVRNNKCQVTI